MPIEFKEKVENLFKNSEKFSDSDGVLFIPQILEAIEKIDGDLIKILISDASAKSHFFTKIEDVYVLDQNKLIEFFMMNDHMKNGSYTSYTNKIGLIKKDSFIKKFDDVVLAWPHKDCVLEGGQTKDDDKSKETFYNEILNHDEIDRLFEPKVLTDIKRYSVIANEVKQSMPTEINDNDNLIIKGNNLLALHSLKKKFAGKVKLIYIDPPYNTGNDSFGYNDNFNHSTWLTFMKNRLEVAKDFLSDDGVIFVQCDDNEQAYLKVLMDEVFSKNFLNTISVKMNESKGLKNAHIEKKMPKNKEYIHIYANQSFLFCPKKIDKEDYELHGYVKYYNKYIININDDVKDWKLTDFDKGKDIDTKLKYKDSLVYFVKPDNDVKIHLEVGKFIKITNSKNKTNVFYNNGIDILKVLFLGENISRFLGDLWTHISTININKEGGVKTLENGQKPEELLKTIIELSTKPNDLIMDYHLGSGTTCAVAHKMERQYIGIEQMDYIETISVERMKKVIEGEQGGISKAIEWKGGGSFVYAELKTIDIFKNAEIGKLNKNMQYLPIGEIEDEEYGVSAEEIAVNKAFYGLE